MEENLVVKNKSTFLIVLKTIFAIIYTGVTLWLLWGYIDVLNATNNQALSLSLFLALLVIIYGSIFYGLSLLIAIVGLIISIIKKSKFNIISFIIAICLPIVSEAGFIIASQILATMI
ncbi:MAG: hypothetical protein E7342_02480 [Clostridiales bacterium]|nr:hypothetical protein [Clostridiales bacterium]